MALNTAVPPSQLLHSPKGGESYSTKTEKYNARAKTIKYQEALHCVSCTVLPHPLIISSTPSKAAFENLKKRGSCRAFMEDAAVSRL